MVPAVIGEEIVSIVLEKTIVCNLPKAFEVYGLPKLDRKFAIHWPEFRERKNNLTFNAMSRDLLQKIA